MRQITTPDWTAAGFLGTAKTWPGLFAWFASDGVLPIINVLVPWGHTLIGISLVLGVSVRLSSSFGAMMMIFYYLPRLDFPMVGPNSFIVEYHLVYAILLVYLGAAKAGEVWGLERWLMDSSPAAPWFRSHPGLRPWLT
jgi:thiosulfate dehydrogenase [quinone] large subunit